MKIQRLIRFPESRQGTNFSCGASSVQAMLYFYGQEVREDKLIKEMPVYPTQEEKPVLPVKAKKTEHSGIPPAKIVDYFRKKGLSAVLTRGMTIDQLKSLLKEDRPVILAIQAWNKHNYKPGATPRPDFYDKTYDDGHYVVAIGYGVSSSGDPAIILEDPSIMSNRGWLTEQELLNRWHDKDSAGNVYNGLGIHIEGARQRYNPKAMRKIL